MVDARVPGRPVDRAPAGAGERFYGADEIVVVIVPV
jgi:hypothetical protein